MNKQQFCAMSLRNGLKFLSIRDNSICTLFSIANHGYELRGKINLKNGTDIKSSIWIDYANKNPNNLDTELYFKPILRNLSDLTKPITHKGETFVPIIELAKIYYTNHEWKLSSSGLYACVGNEYMTFEYDYGYNCFLCNNSAQLDQLNCLLKTIEWHFDIAGLIEKGEAIDVNTLETNPYK